MQTFTTAGAHNRIDELFFCASPPTYGRRASHE